MAQRLAERKSIMENLDSPFLIGLKALPEIDMAAELRGSQARDLALQALNGLIIGLNKGDLERAIAYGDWLEARLAEQAFLLDPDEKQDFLWNAAKLHLRYGEERNCIANHNLDSCLFPIQGGGLHMDRGGSERAIAFLSTLLEEKPSDLGARWLLNVAHMTLGSYPEGVPERYRIAPEAFASETDIGRFPDVAPRAGLASRGLSGGVVLDDLDGDGLLDVMVSSWGFEDPLEVFINQGDGRFLPKGPAAGLAGINGGLNMVHADYDADGDIDVLVLRGAWMGSQGRWPNSLLRNRGDGSFDDVTEEAGLLHEAPSQTAAWADYDNDGDLDLFVGNESDKVDPKIRSGQVAFPSELYENQGDGSFRKRGARAGLNVVGFVKGSAWGDYDNDGRLDLYVSRLGEANLLMHNLGPDEEGVWRFEDRAAEAGVQEPNYSFPTWFWDYDNDGLLDLFVAGFGRSGNYLDGAAADVGADVLGLGKPAETPRLYRNLGDGRFEDRTESAALDDVLLAMGANYGDLNNDGWPDAYVGTGEPDFDSLVPNKAYLGAADGRFLDVTSSAGLGQLQKGHGIALADLDNDGDQDILANLGGSAPGDWFFNALFENPGQGNRWITLRLAGAGGNRNAIGARVEARVETQAGPRSIHHLVGSGGSFGASSLQAEMGLGDATTIPELVVTWPGSGLVQAWTDLPLDRILELREGEEGWTEVQLPTIELPEPVQPGEMHEHG